MGVFKPANTAHWTPCACASITACANNQPSQTALDYQSPPSPSAQTTNSTPTFSDQDLTLHEDGVEINLPPIFRDLKNWSNEGN